MKNTARVKVVINPTSRILRDKGLTAGGDVQRFHTANVLRRIARYMPYRTGATVKLTEIGTNINKPYIVTETPYAKYIYYGKAMEGKAPKKATERDLIYTKTKNPRAGPYWDRALAAAEGAAIRADLQRYISRKR